MIVPTVIGKTRMHEIDRNFKWPVSAEQQIAAPREEVWRVISAPGNLEHCHPFCRKNPVAAWDGANSRDEIYYLSGWVYERRFREWHDGRGYDLETFRGDKRIAVVSWRIEDVDEKNCALRITVYPMVLQNWPVVARWFAYWLRIKPYLRSYLRSVVMGFDWYVTKGEPVPRNAFGTHPWFSAE